MDINNLFEFERIKERLKHIDRTLINDQQLQRQLADLDRTQRDIDRFERNRRDALDHANPATLREIDRLAKEATEFAQRKRTLSDFDPVKQRLDEFDRARARLDQASQIDRDIARLQGLDRRVREYEYAQKRIAEFERTQKRFREYDDLQRRLSDSEKLLARRNTADSIASQAMRGMPHLGISPAAFNSDELFRRSGADPARLLNTIQERAATAFALTDREADLVRARMADISVGARVRDYFQGALNSRDIFTASERARASFLSEVTTSVREAMVDSASDEEAIEKIANLVAEKVKSPPKGMSTVELVMIILGVAQVVLMVGAFLYQTYMTNYQIADSQRSGQEQREFQEKLLTVMGQIAENMKKPEVEGVHYVVERPVEVKSSPRFKSMTIDRIPENSRVRVLLVQHKWAFVEYAESLNLEPRSGWVSKKYLRRII